MRMSTFVYIWEGDQSRLAIPVKKVYLRHAIHYDYINILFNVRKFYMLVFVHTYTRSCRTWYMCVFSMSNLLFACQFAKLLILSRLIITQGGK